MPPLARLDRLMRIPALPEATALELKERVEHAMAERVIPRITRFSDGTRSLRRCLRSCASRL